MRNEPEAGSWLEANLPLVPFSLFTYSFLGFHVMPTIQLRLPPPQQVMGQKGALSSDSHTRSRRCTIDRQRICSHIHGNSARALLDLRRESHHYILVETHDDSPLSKPEAAPAACPDRRRQHKSWQQRQLDIGRQDRCYRIHQHELFRR